MFKLLNPWMILGVLLAISTAGGVGYMSGGQNMKNEIESDIAREERIGQIAFANSLSASAQQIAKIRIENTTIRQELDREIRFEPVYIDCRHSDAAKRMLDAILTGSQPPESFDRSLVPAADRAK